MRIHIAILISILGAPAAALAQIDTGIIEKHKAALEKQITDPDQKREGGTQPRDWDYQLPEGVRTRQVTFYVDGGTALYGKLFLPKGFTPGGKLPAVVVGHGINALSIGIEKFAARFAERGLVAMAIDYQSYGFSSSGSDDIRLLEPDTTTDARAVTEKDGRILLKRTNLNNVHEVADFRAAVSFLQGEPGIDADRIGIWGSSNGGSVVIAALSHFQAYSNAGFEVGSNLAADWFLKYLASARPVLRDTTPQAGKPAVIGGVTGGIGIPRSAIGPTREVTFYSEGIRAYAKLYFPSNFSAGSNAAAVIVAPAPGTTATSVESEAAAIARSGMVAVAIDYRGWGKSGAFIYLADPVRWDDRLRFSQHTAKVRLRRMRRNLEAQVIDIRNAITYIQGEPGVDATRIGVMGTDLAGLHVVAVAANDARVKAGVAGRAVEWGKGVERTAFVPSASLQSLMIKLARTGQAPATEEAARAMNVDEDRLSVAEYAPFRYVDQIPKDTAMLYLDGNADAISAPADFFAKSLTPK